jgi:PBP1b-binding outer membrane lipoprotein LpoB
MKKVFLSLAIVATLTVVSCKQADAAPAEAVDTTAVAEAVDTAAAMVDTAAAKVDTAAAKVEAAVEEVKK